MRDEEEGDMGKRFGIYYKDKGGELVAVPGTGLYVTINSAMIAAEHERVAQGLAEVYIWDFLDNKIL